MALQDDFKKYFEAVQPGQVVEVPGGGTVTGPGTPGALPGAAGPGSDLGGGTGLTTGPGPTPSDSRLPDTGGPAGLLLALGLLTLVGGGLLLRRHRPDRV